MRYTTKYPENTYNGARRREQVVSPRQDIYVSPFVKIIGHSNGQAGLFIIHKVLFSKIFG